MAYKKSNQSKKKQEEPTLTEELTTVLEEIKEEPEKKKGETVFMLDEINFVVDERQYQVVHNHRDAFNADKFGERYSEVLSRYDYIVGDWGYDQLRLKGFFSADNRKVPVDQRIDTLEDYLYEFCNFGCAYFVVERTGGKREKQQTRRQKRKKNPSRTPKAHIDERKGPVTGAQKIKKNPVIKNRAEKKETQERKPQNKKPATQTKGKREFTIRQKDGE